MNNIYIIATITFSDISIDDAKIKMANVVRKSQAESGNIQYTLHQDLSSHNSFIFYEIWEDEHAFDMHKASSHFRNFFAFVKKHATNVDIRSVSLFEL